MDWYLPPYKGTSMVFIQQLLNGEKKAFLKSEIAKKSVPKYAEFRWTTYGTVLETTVT